MEPGTTFLFDEASLTVTEAIQRGGFGAVFGAEVLGCPGAPDGFAIAVKHLTRRPKETPVPTNPIADRFLRRVEREVLLLSVLNRAHPRGFVRYLGHSYEDGNAFVYMQRADLDLYSYAFEHTSLDDGRWTWVSDHCNVDHDALAYELLHSLAAMHEIGYAHRDVKLENILLRCPSGQRCTSLIADVDTACAFAPGLANPCEIASGPVGSPANWAPEAWVSGRKAWSEGVKAMDVWALGLVICEVYSRLPCVPDEGQRERAGAFEVLTQAPEKGAALAAQVASHAKDSVASMLADPKVPWWVPSLLESMMSEVAGARCTAAECFEFLRNALPAEVSRGPRVDQRSWEDDILRNIKGCVG